MAEPACLAALRSAAACVSGIVLEAGVQKQQGAEDKQAIRDSLNTATVASTVEGCEDLCSNRAINPPRTSWSRHLSAARRTTPRRRLSATSHIRGAGLSHFQTPCTYITALIGSQGTGRFSGSRRHPRAVAGRVIGRGRARLHLGKTWSQITTAFTRTLVFKFVQVNGTDFRNWDKPLSHFPGQFCNL